MNIFRAMKPDLVVSSVKSIDFQALKARGISVVLLDFDNTLGPDHATEPTDYSRECVSTLDALGFEMCLVSNAKSGRSSNIAAMLGIPCITYAHKPNPSGVYRALDMMKAKPEQACMIGDQVFTDVIAGRLSGCYTILVERYSRKEIWYVKAKRPFERIVRFFARF
ncbi:MAG: YqeG family HAD IIIA-type phosphatase [Clostridiales bacterium]|nr:YqeG family HAD IIIA-type phosphatase [Clostridiales bacterium]